MVYELKTSSERRRRRRAASTERIIATAMRMLATEGLAGLTVHRLAEALDYTVGAMYRYFPSKDALIAEMELRVVQAFHRAFDAAGARFAVAAEGAAAKSRAVAELQLTAIVFARLPDLHPEGFALVSQTLADPRHVIGDAEDARTSAALGDLVRSVAARFDAAEKAGALTPGAAPERAAIFWSALQGAMLLRKLDRIPGDLFDPKALWRVHTDTLLTAWGVTPQQLAAARRLVTAAEDKAALVTKKDLEPGSTS
jgi:AcrR family transcriptional regulator